MFHKESLKTVKRLEKEWKRVRRDNSSKVQEDASTHPSPNKLKPVYTPLDLEGKDVEDIGFPGIFPYTRGTTSLGYSQLPWMMRINIGYGTGRDTRERWEYLKKIGMRLHVGRDEETDEFPKFNILTDLPHQRGWDADDIEAQGRVGDSGVSISTIEDLDLLFSELPLDKLNVTFITFDPTLALTAMYVVYARRRGYDLSQLRMQTPHTLYNQWYWDTASFSPKNALKLMVENINYRIKHMPLTFHTSLSGYSMAQCGATAVQELAFTHAMVKAIMDECCRVGLEPNEVASRFWYHAHLGMELFEEVSKIRAWRRLWAKTMKKRYGCTDDRALKIFIFSMTSGLSCTAQEPLNNIIRLTILTLAGILAGADSIGTAAYDEALAIPSQDAAHLAVRTQQILFHETHIPEVADPLGGSYYVESLTDELEKKALDLLDKIKELGGAIKCWESGWFRKQLLDSANDWQDKFNRGENIQVGVNKYRLDRETQKVNVFKHDPKFEKEAVERVKCFKANRNNQKVGQALEDLSDAAETFLAEWPSSCGTLMPKIFKAVEADATCGEIQKVLGKKCGYGYTY